MQHAPDSRPLAGGDNSAVDRTDDDWVGSPVDSAERTERVWLDPGSVERVERTTPENAGGVGRASRPQTLPRMPAARVKYREGDRERDADPLYIVNRDDRLIYNDWRYPWGLVCRVQSFDGSFGSGALIGPRHVLTASHVVDWTTDDPIRVEVHAFDSGQRAWAGVTVAGAYTRVSEDASFSYTDEDYAVLVLDQRLGDRFGWMGTKTYNSSWDHDELWTTMGYSEDLGGTRRPSWQPPFYLDEDAWDYGWGRAMDTNADLMHGQSGSPVFATWSDGPYAVAVVAAQVDGDNYCAGGVGLPSLVNGVRGKYP